MVYNISDHCVVAILQLLTSDWQRFLNQSVRMCLYNWFKTFCQRWLNWNKSERDVLTCKLCYFPFAVATSNSWHYSCPRPVYTEYWYSCSLCSSLKYTDWYIFHTIGEINTGNKRSVRFTQLWSKHFQFREEFILNHKKRLFAISIRHFLHLVHFICRKVTFRN